MTPIGPLRALWLLVALRLTRFSNQLISAMRRMPRGNAGGRRAATPSKSRLGWLLGSLVAAAMLFSFTNVAFRAVAHIEENAGLVPTAGEALRRLLGVETEPLTRREAQSLGFAGGVKVITSLPGSPAATAGLRAGDVVYAIDGRAITDAAALNAKVGAKAPGSDAELWVRRDAKLERVFLKLGKRPQLKTGLAQGGTGRTGALKACALEVLILAIATLFASLASRELARQDWDLEWLATLPVPLTTLLGVRILERTLVNPTGLLTLWPFLSVVSWASGYRIAAPLLGLAATMPLLLVVATIWTVLDTGLRLKVGPPRLRNLQATVSVAAIGCLFLAMSAGLSKASYVLNWATALSDAIFFSAPGLAIGALASSTPTAAGSALLALVLQAVLCAALGLVILDRQLRQGVVAAAGRESGRRAEAEAAPVARDGARGKRRLLSPVQAREVILLLRDRNFLVQTLILPVLIVGGQVFFGAPESALAFALTSPREVAAAAFGVAAYALMFSAFQTLNAEGQALWILYCVPRSLESILREKALLWGSVCLLYAVAILGVPIALNPSLSLEQALLMVVVLLGVPIFATISAALGVFACDPVAQQVERRVKPSYLYLYMLLATLYAYAIYANNFWQRLGLCVLTALLALALWQKARDHLPFLLDPAAAPPARVAAADGLIAALLFFVLQGVAVRLLASFGEKLSGRVLLMAFLLAGAATYGVMRLAYWRLGTEGVPRTLPPRLGPALATGAIGGVIAALVAVLYLKLAAHTFLFVHARETLLGDGVLWLAVLAVVAAPIFEEFIFRGLIFGGLRRSLGLTTSLIASAGIFALVHPPAAVIPVFGLGVATALAYERTRVLLAPMAVHAIYNAAVIADQLFGL